jgi:hypothetical protein
LFIPRGNVRVESHADDDDGGWEEPITRPPELSGNPTRRDMWERVGGMDKEVGISNISIFGT